LQCTIPRLAGFGVVREGWGMILKRAVNWLN
jgi:hypothetical protein